VNHDVALISAYHDGVLPPSKRRQVESHLRACPECRAILSDYQKLKKGLEALPRRQAPADMLGEIKAQAAAERLRRRRLARFGPLAGVAAATAAAAAAFLAGTLLPAATPVPLPEPRPVVAFAVPAPGVGQLPQEAVIELHFETPVDRAAVEQSIAVSPPVPAQLQWDQEKLRIVPETKLAPDTEYTISVAPSGPEPSPSPYTLRLRTAPPATERPAVAPDPAPPAPAGALSMPAPTPTPSSPQPATVLAPPASQNPGDGRILQSCTVAPFADLARRASEQPELLSKLGCATAAEARVTVAEQPFELGMLVWRSDLRWTYALQGQPRRWTSYAAEQTAAGAFETLAAGAAASVVRPSSFLAVTATPSASAREVPTEPSPTFLDLWRLHPDLRVVIGGPVRRERQGLASVQDFQNGLAVVTDWGAVYALYGDRSWGYLPDPDDNPRFRR
jgi:hypothetical protein